MIERAIMSTMSFEKYARKMKSTERMLSLMGSSASVPSPNPKFLNSCHTQLSKISPIARATNIQTLSSPTQICTSGKQFMADNSRRESAKWVEALDRLIEWGWVKPVGYKGEIFELTGTGYDKADWLKEGMGIDTSIDPLEELKEFDV